MNVPDEWAPPETKPYVPGVGISFFFVLCFIIPMFAFLVSIFIRFTGKSEMKFFSEFEQKHQT